MDITSKKLRIKTGNQMIAEGAIQAGCKFFAGYPITPASGVYKGMIDHLPRVGGAAVSSPDEISAIAYCIGASMRGFKAMTATSGPGWSLMIETIQYALITETPLVIAYVQRLGPCTGGATQGGQGDILFTEYITSGGYTIPVLYPTTARECFEQTVLAFSWAEKLRMPVVLLSDKEIGMTSESVDYTGLHELQSASRPRVDSGNSDGWKMFGFDSPEMIPLFTEVGGRIKVTTTGSAHNMQGELKKNDPETMQVLRHLEDKVQARRDELVLVHHDAEPGARTLLLSFGITARTMKEAVRRLRAAGRTVSALTIHSLYPVPEEAILQAAAGVERVVIPEENMQGQYRQVISGLLHNKSVIGVNKIGAMITPDEIIEKVL